MGNTKPLWKLKVYHRQSGALLAQGSFSDCAEQLNVSKAALRRAEWDSRVHRRQSRREWIFERKSIQAKYKMIDCKTEQVIDEGTIPELVSRHIDTSYDGIQQVLIHKKRGRKPKIYDYQRIK